MSIFEGMRNIPINKMVELWDQLLWLEKATDNELVSKIGLSTSTPSTWRAKAKEQPESSVRISTLGMIENALSLRINLRDNKWVIEKVEPLTLREPVDSIYSKAHLSETEGGLSPEDVRLLDSLSEKLSAMAKQIEELKKKKK